MAVLVPAILPVSREDLEQKLGALVGLVESVQIDVIDGRFAAPASWPYGSGSEAFAQEINQGAMLPYSGDFHFEMDLMVSDPEEVTGIWVTAGADRIILHSESTNYLPRAITDLEVKYGYSKEFAPELLSMGLAINIQSPLALIEPYIDSADFVQFMGIDTIGRQGEPFDERVLQKIRTFKKKHPDMKWQVDGGISLTTAPALISLGIDRLIVGSALQNAPDIAAELQKFQDLLEEYDVYR